MITNMNDNERKDAERVQLEQLQAKLQLACEKLGASDVRLGETMGLLNMANLRAYAAEEKLEELREQAEQLTLDGLRVAEALPDPVRDLPPALTQRERKALAEIGEGERALAWIDNATARIAELENTTLREAAHEHGAMLQRQSAFAAIGARAERAELDLKVALNRMLALKPTVEANDACAAAEAKLATANALIAEQAAQLVADGQALEQFRATVVSLTQDLERERADRAALVEQAAYYKREKEGLEARVRELEAALDQERCERIQLESTDNAQLAAAEQKLLETNELIRAHIDANDAIEKELESCDGSDGGFAYVGQSYPTLDALRAHLSGQPAAPTPDRGICRGCGRVEHRPGFLGCTPAAPAKTRFEQRLERTAYLTVSVMASSSMPVTCPGCGYSGDRWEHTCPAAPSHTEVDGVYPSIREPSSNRTDPPWTSGTAVDHIPCLEAMAAVSVRTEAEQAVLDACAAMQLGDDDPDADPLEPQELGDDCYIYTDDQCAIARAELALRGLK